VVTGKRIPAVTTAQIYKGSIAFIILQVIMIAVIVLNPGLVSGGITKVKQLDAEKVEELLNIETNDYSTDMPAFGSDQPADGEANPSDPVKW
jgi:hypothetical protein